MNPGTGRGGAKVVRAWREHPVLALQRSVGNRATGRVLARDLLEDYKKLESSDQMLADEALDYTLRIASGDSLPMARDWLLKLLDGHGVTIGQVMQVAKEFEKYVGKRQPDQNQVDRLREVAQWALAGSELVPEQLKREIPARLARFHVHGLNAFGRAYLENSAKVLPAVATNPHLRAHIVWDSLAGTVGATTRPEHGGILIRAGYDDLHNAVHEGLHALSGRGWISLESFDLNVSKGEAKTTLIEGVTEKLTRAIVGGGGYYDTEIEKVEQVLKEHRITIVELADMYFEPIERFLARIGRLSAHAPAALVEPLAQLPAVESAKGKT